MRRTKTCAALAGALAAAAAHGQISLCTPITNGDFSIGSALWSVDVETGEFGDTGAGVFTEFDPLSLLPNQGNVATFFTEALAEGDCEFPLGSAANSTVFLSRKLTSAPGGNLRFAYGAQISFVLLGDGEVEYAAQLIFRNLDSGKEAKCPLAGGKVVNQIDPGVEGFITVPFQKFDVCDCPDAVGLTSSGDPVEILLVVSVRAESRKEGGSAFIGGPFFFDDFQFCNIACPIPNPGEVSQAGAPTPQIVTTPLPPAVRSEPAGAAWIERLDLDADGVVGPADYLLRAEAEGLPDLTGASPDLNADGVVDDDDVAEMLAIMDGLLPADDARADLNADGVIDAEDLSILINAVN